MKPHTTQRHRKPVYRAFPITIYEALAASAVAVAVISWVFFSIDLSGVETGGAVAIFTLITLLIPFTIWRTSKWRKANRNIPSNRTGDWLKGQFEIWQSRIKSRDAAILALLPPLSVAIGLALIAIVAQLIAAHLI